MNTLRGSLFIFCHIYFVFSAKMFVIIKKGANVYAFIVGFDDAKRVTNGYNQRALNYLKTNELKLNWYRFLGHRFFLLKYFLLIILMAKVFETL